MRSRKRLCGALSSLGRLGPEGYSPQVSDRVYATVVERARATVRGGHSAIVDAVCVRPKDRQAIEQVAADASVPFIGLWLDAPESTLIERVEQRRNDPSDANADVICMHRGLYALGDRASQLEGAHGVFRDIHISRHQSQAHLDVIRHGTHALHPLSLTLGAELEAWLSM